MDQDKPPIQPTMNYGPGMRIVLLISLYLACIFILQMFDRWDGFGWLLIDAGEEIPLSLMRLGNVIGSIVIFAIPALVITNIFPVERFHYLRLHIDVRWSWLILAAVALVLSVYAVDPIYNWLEKQMTDPDLLKQQELAEKYSRQLLQMSGIGDLFTCLLVLALFPAFAEELFFRAVLQQTLGEWIRNRHIAVWVSAFIFALLHADLVGIPIIFLMGLVLGYLFFWTGSLRINILGHFAFNATTIVNIYANQHYPYSYYVNWEPGIFVTIGMVLVAALCLFIINRQTRMHPDMLV